MFFTRPQSRPSTSDLTPKPCHVPLPACKDLQLQSPLLSLLSAELRNQIYTYVFTSSPPSEASPSPSPHPLSLLLTCRRIHHEAALLAFTTYTFPITPTLKPSYIHLQIATMHLSDPQKASLNALSLDLGNNYISNAHTAGTLLTNAILSLPNLHRFEIRIPRSRKMEYEIHPQQSSPDASDIRRAAVHKYVPRWFRQGVITSVVGGHTYAWPEGAGWRVDWPVMESAMCYSTVECGDDGVIREELCMDEGAVATVSGVHMCACDCGGVSWLSAVLTQERGRRVEVETVFYGSPEPVYVPDVCLVPGTEPLVGVVCVPQDISGGVVPTAIGFEVDEEYWDAIRRRNGRLDALWRGLWKGVLWPAASVTPEDVVDRLEQSEVE
jgi:hypothetical protein